MTLGSAGGQEDVITQGWSFLDSRLEGVPGNPLFWPRIDAGRMSGEGVSGRRGSGCTRKRTALRFGFKLWQASLVKLICGDVPRRPCPDSVRGAAPMDDWGSVKGGEAYNIDYPSLQVSVPVFPPRIDLMSSFCPCSWRRSSSPARSPPVE